MLHIAQQRVDILSDAAQRVGNGLCTHYQGVSSRLTAHPVEFAALLLEKRSTAPNLR
jgi:hypothetical protein